MADYAALFTKRAIPALISSYFVRASSGTDRNLAGVYSEVLSGVPAFDGSDGLILEAGSTDQIRNNSGTGAVAGTPGTRPTNWGLFNPQAMTQNVVGTGVQNGIAYTDIRFYGTPGSTGSLILFLETDTQIVAAAGETWTLSAFMAVVAGSISGLANAPKLNMTENTAAGGYVTEGAGSAMSSISSTLERQASYTRTLTGGTTARVKPGLLINIVSGQAFDITLRIGWPQIEKLPAATSPIPTTSAAVTRALAHIGGGTDGIPFSAIGLAAGRTNNIAFHVLVKVPFSSAVAQTGSRTMFSFRAGTSAEGLAVNLTTTAGRVLLEGTVNGNYVTAIADGLTWAANSWLNIAGTKSAADGLIIYVNGTAAVNTTANAKAAFSSAITGCNLNSRNSNLDQTAIGIGVYAGFKIWDGALSDAELSALSADDLSHVNTFGVAAAPPWGFPSSNLQEGDQVYMRKISGVDGVFTAEALGFVPAGRSTIEIHAFNAATQRWLVIRRVAFFPGKAMKVTRRDILSIYYMTGAKMDIVRAFVMQDGLKKEIF